MSAAKSFNVEIHVVEDGPTTNARASITIGGEQISATGRARRNPDDPDRPMIGDELAIARSLVVLARELGKKVDEGIAAYEGHEVHIQL